MTAKGPEEKGGLMRPWCSCTAKDSSGYIENLKRRFQALYKMATTYNQQGVEERSTDSWAKVWSGGRSGFNLSFTEKIKTTTVLHASLIQLLLQLLMRTLVSLRLLLSRLSGLLFQSTSTTLIYCETVIHGEKNCKQKIGQRVAWQP